jgi:hypothetical protein
MIQEICNGNISYFLQQNTLVLSDRLRTLLKQQINRLSELEKEVVYWLAIERQPISLSRLRANLLLPPWGFPKLFTRKTSPPRSSYGLSLPTKVGQPQSPSPMRGGVWGGVIFIFAKGLLSTHRLSDHRFRSHLFKLIPRVKTRRHL